MAQNSQIDKTERMPVYRQVGKLLRRRITKGELAPGTQIPSARDLCKEYNVAYGTVLRSLRVLRNEGLVTGTPCRGTFVTSRILSTKNIAVTVDRLFHEQEFACFERFLRSVSEGCAKTGFHVNLFELPDGSIFGSEQPTLLSKLIQDHEISAVITASAAPLGDIERLARSGIPVVTNRDQYPYTTALWVTEDVADGAKQLVDFIVGGLRHRRIGLVVGAKAEQTAKLIKPSTLFMETVINELKNRGIKFDEKNLTCIDYRWMNVAPRIREWLKSSNRPTALIFYGDELAMQCLRLASELGLNVPQDLSITGYSDSLPRSHMTSIYIPLEEMALEAVRMLEKMMDGARCSPKYFPAKLMIRQTCGLAPQ
ncbi:MAG: hypothetical protein A2Y12_09750 [Planctomycetes bacterium GWF2_42_9]|nr:MAG: hypothetical protein A2Y12_09750 [Planctomycetes bacterium GWF2_42_9]